MGINFVKEQNHNASNFDFLLPVYDANIQTGQPAALALGDVEGEPLPRGEPLGPQPDRPAAALVAPRLRAVGGKLEFGASVLAEGLCNWTFT